ncbi:MAG: SRPBCC family protein [Thermomicrobiales bacterium]
MNVCPAVVVNAPVERVWALLADPARFDDWWDAQTVRVTPPGPAQAGQVIYGRSQALGRWWDVRAEIIRVDAARHRLVLHTTLPLGLALDNQITCAPLDDGATRVQFG